MFSRCKASRTSSTVKLCEVKFLRVEQDANLPRLAAIQLDAAYTIDTSEWRAHLLIGNLGQFAQAHRTADQNGHDRVRLRIFFGDYRGKSFPGQAIDGCSNFFPHVLGGAFDLALQNEGAGNFSLPSVA